MTRLSIGSVVVALGLLAIAPTARAQAPNLPPGFGAGRFDPFSAYYGYYLPRNQSIAAQLAGGANETVNLNAQARRMAMMNARNEASLYELNNPYEMVPLEQRSFVRPPTVLLPGQPAGPAPAAYFGRSAPQMIGARTGAPGSIPGGAAAASARLPQQPRMGVGGIGMGGMPMGGFGGFGGFGGGFR